MEGYPDSDEEFELMYGDELELLREQEDEQSTVVNKTSDKRTTNNETKNCVGSNNRETNNGVTNAQTPNSRITNNGVTTQTSNNRITNNAITKSQATKSQTTKETSESQNGQKETGEENAIEPEPLPTDYLDDDDLNGISTVVDSQMENADGSDGVSQSQMYKSDSFTPSQNLGESRWNKRRIEELFGDIDDLLGGEVSGPKVKKHKSKEENDLAMIDHILGEIFYSFVCHLFYLVTILLFRYSFVFFL